MDKIKIIMADNYSLFTDGLAQLFGNEGDIECIAVARKAKEAVRLARQLKPDIVLLDIAIPVMGGAETCRLIKDALPHTGIIILTHDACGHCLLEAMKAGADGYLLKCNTFQYLVGAIRVVHGGGNVYDRQVSNSTLRSIQIANGTTYLDCKLTQRELEIIELAAGGHSYRKIADRLGISEHTVGSHFSNIYRKLGVQSRTEAVLYGLKRHWYRLGGTELEMPNEPPYLPDWKRDSNS